MPKLWFEIGFSTQRNQGFLENRLEKCPRVGQEMYKFSLKFPVTPDGEEVLQTTRILSKGFGLIGTGTL